MRECDVLIVGAGPAGSMAARAAAPHCDVVVLEKRAQIGVPKQCAEGTSDMLFDKLNLPVNPKWISRRIEFARLISPSGIKVDLKEDRFKQLKFGYVLERKKFDKGLAEIAARNGADMFLRTRYIGSKRENNHVIVKARQFNTDLIFKAKIVIAADGIMSQVARDLGINSVLDVRHLESCCQYEMTGVEQEACIELYFGNEIAPKGYAWIFPKEHDTANVGIGILPTKTQYPAKYFLDKFVSWCGLQGKIVEINAGGVPVSGPLKKTVADNLILVGDAGHMANPITGGGIHTAMLSGNFAGNTAVKAVETRDGSEKFLNQYETLWKKEFGKELDISLKGRFILEEFTDQDFDETATFMNEKGVGQLGAIDLVRFAIGKHPKFALKFASFLKPG
ncbi:MAG: NAD(P)/FAD-dependent oxidoreductase [Theionarchaea archaeon]|nr:NAD(P)/FAD-dependent oxidoreductase [Theionarchaea archaeon]